jgi:hypothetical protein
MARLSKKKSKLHHAACDLLKKDKLTYEEKEFVLQNWNESAEHTNGVAGAFFTPIGLARSLAVEADTTGMILDLCAGIGVLGFALRPDGDGLTCVEINPAYVAVGQKILPKATWICADAFGYMGYSHVVIANPPYGKVNTHKNVYGRFEYDLINFAVDRARRGVFLIPQSLCPFQYSGGRQYVEVVNNTYQKFSEATGVVFEMNCGIDTSIHAAEWASITKPPLLEIVNTRRKG